MKSLAEIETLVEELEYDFDQFELNHFLSHVESCRRRQLIVQPFPFDSALYGMWVHAVSADYIFYARECHPVHQVHTILHEVGHMVLGHPFRPLDQLLPPDLLAALGLLHPAGHLRMAPNPLGGQPPEERECEIFAWVIQGKVVKKNRLHQLTGQNSSIVRLRPYADSVNPGRFEN